MVETTSSGYLATFLVTAVYLAEAQQPKKYRS